MMVVVMSSGIRKARKSHQCFECYRSIAPGETYVYQSNVYDGCAYTIKWHVDCGECGAEYRANADAYYYDEGYPPLRDEWRDSGEYEETIEEYRGRYPHVIARMELTDQLFGSGK